MRPPEEPIEGCEHIFYARQFGLAHVFNHSDPTREIDYRYLIACIERFRNVLASEKPKLFVQMRERDAKAEQDFAETYNILDKLTRNAAFLQIVVSSPNRLRTIPEFNVISARGKHTLYHMNPTSKLGGQRFSGKADTETVEALIASYGRQDPYLFSPVDHVSPVSSPNVSASLTRIYAMAHIANRGDTDTDETGWTGACGSGLEIQGLSLHLGAGLPSDSFVYQVALEPNEFSARATAGTYRGTRGLGKPIYGIRIFVAEHIRSAFKVSVEASFIDGSHFGPAEDQSVYEPLSKSPLEAIRILAIKV